jgi:hypothetical protein
MSLIMLAQIAGQDPQQASTAVIAAAAVATTGTAVTVFRDHHETRRTANAALKWTARLSLLFAILAIAGLVVTVAVSLIGDQVAYDLIASSVTVALGTGSLLTRQLAKNAQQFALNAGQMGVEESDRNGNREAMLRALEQIQNPEARDQAASQVAITLARSLTVPIPVEPPSESAGAVVRAEPPALPSS